MKRQHLILVFILILMNLMLLFIYSKSKTREELPKSVYDINTYGLSNFTQEARDEIINHFKDGGYFALTVINQNSCLTCIVNEIELLNRYPDLHENILVYFIGKDDQFLIDRGAHFDYQTKESIDQLFMVDIKQNNPFTIVLDRNFVYDLHLVDTAKPHNVRLKEAHYSFLTHFFISD